MVVDVRRMKMSVTALPGCPLLEIHLGVSSWSWRSTSMAVFSAAWTEASNSTVITKPVDMSLVRARMRIFSHLSRRACLNYCRSPGTVSFWKSRRKSESRRMQRLINRDGSQWISTKARQAISGVESRAEVKAKFGVGRKIADAEARFSKGKSKTRKA